METEINQRTGDRVRPLNVDEKRQKIRESSEGDSSCKRLEIHRQRVPVPSFPNLTQNTEQSVEKARHPEPRKKKKTQPNSLIPRVHQFPKSLRTANEPPHPAIQLSGPFRFHSPSLTITADATRYTESRSLANPSLPRQFSDPGANFSLPCPSTHMTAQPVVRALLLPAPPPLPPAPSSSSCACCASRARRRLLLPPAPATPASSFACM